MRRKIIAIDPERCDGCGLCLPDCPEGALQLIDGKARLVSDLFCDGLGACIGTCPRDAIRVEEREAEAYDELKVMAHIVSQGANVIRAHLGHLAAHNEQTYLEQARQFLREKGIPLPETGKEEGAGFSGCPGVQEQDRRGREPARPAAVPAAGDGRPSELRTWPVQLQLLNPQASIFDDADLLIAADCVPFACASFHEDFLKGKVPVIFCPKLDATIEQYLEKLTAILRLHAVRSLHVVRMEVPCCSGATALVRQALARSGKAIALHDHTVSIRGKLLAVK